ncbi:MAG: LysM peptidoglycan-binding domain-containing protein [Planctomycetes bacterium]|nr:LysM peptidoglycan-binding domain-containing protein [Planctomycetota bacterium]
MRSDLKIGILVGALLVVGVVLYIMSRGGDSTDPANIPVVNDIENPGGGTSPALAGEGTAEQELQTAGLDPGQGTTATGEVGTPPNEGKAEPPEVGTPPEEKVVTPPTQAVPPPDDLNDERQPRFHTVKEGDNLSAISLSFYGDGKFGLVIQKVNADKITDRNKLQTGWRLRIPYPEEAKKIWSER